MAIAIHVQDYLNAQGVAYEIVTHPRAMTMLEAARRATVSGDCVAKGVVLEDDDGYLLAVVPASRAIKFSRLSKWLDRRLGLATEPEVATLFDDCEFGAIPATGAAYGLPMILDDSLAEQPDIYFEGGDHRSLIHISGDDFRRLMAETPHGRFSSPPGASPR